MAIHDPLDAVSKNNRNRGRNLAGASNSTPRSPLFRLDQLEIMGCVGPPVSLMLPRCRSAVTADWRGLHSASLIHQALATPSGARRLRSQQLLSRMAWMQSVARSLVPSSSRSLPVWATRAGKVNLKKAQSRLNVMPARIRPFSHAAQTCDRRYFLSLLRPEIE